MKQKKEEGCHSYICLTISSFSLFATITTFKSYKRIISENNIQTMAEILLIPDLHSQVE
jgi:hypothetical protein